MHEFLLAVTAAVYFGSTVAYIAYLLIGARPQTARVARVAFAVGLVLHSAAIAVRCSRGLPPTISAADTLSFYGWALVTGFLVVQLRYPLPTVGSFLSPLVCLLVLMSLALPKPVTPLDPKFATIWFPIHVTLAVAGDVAFVLAAAVGLMYLIRESSLKTKHITPVVDRLPSLDLLDRINYRLITIGFSLLTLGMLTGGLWILLDPKLKAAVHDPKILWTVSTWVLYAVLLNGRALVGLRGRKAALMSVAGFAMVVVTFVGVNLLGQSFHSFRQ